MAYKVFTNGSVLNASEINDNLMRQSVMVFSNAAARTSAIASPVEGMLTWLEDVNRYEFYNGTAWVTYNTGLVQLATQTFTGVSTVSFNNVFSSLYKDYLFVYSGNQSPSGSNLHYRLRSGGTDNTSSNYTAGAVQITEGGGPTRLYEAGSTWARISNLQIYRSQFTLTVSDPFNPVTTTTAGDYTSFGNTTALGNSWGYHVVSSSFDGISFIVSGGTFAGTITAYGYRS
jgi:hypothetical protein